MRNWQWLGITMVVVGGAASYWYFKATPVILPPIARYLPAAVNGLPQGDAEESDAVEPLIVDRGKAPGAPTALPTDAGPMPRVVLEPGMPQAPRPDVGLVPRMPYADEEEILGLTRPPLDLILEPGLARLNIFDQLDNGNPAEESESRPVEPTPPPPAMPDYHHNHCPYHGGCPLPYHRPYPRD